MDGSIRVAVLGASGFSGGELIRLLHDHPRFEVTFAGARGSVGDTVGGSHPHLASLPAGVLAYLCLTIGAPVELVLLVILLFSTTKLLLCLRCVSGTNGMIRM